MREAPLCHYRPAAADDAGRSLGGQRNVRQPHAGMDRKIIDALLCLFDQRVAIDLPGQIFSLTVHFFERLIDGHGPDRHGGIAKYPFTRGVDVLPRGKVHHSIRSPHRRPTHLFDFLVDRRSDGRVTNIRVDFDEEIAPDDHRLAFGMINIRWDDSPAASDFIADEFWRYKVRYRRTE